MSDDPDLLRRPGVMFMMQFASPIDHIEWDEPTNTLVVMTEEGVSRVKFPEVRK